jgi:hypothetical protein
MIVYSQENKEAASKFNPNHALSMEFGRAFLAEG